MTDQLVEVSNKEHAIWEQLGERREATQRKTKGKYKVMEEDIPSGKEEEHEPPAASLVAVLESGPALQKQKIKIKLKVAQKEKIPLEYEADEEEPLLKKRQDPVSPPPKKRQKERSHRIVDP